MKPLYLLLVIAMVVASAATILTSDTLHGHQDAAYALLLTKR